MESQTTDAALEPFTATQIAESVPAGTAIIASYDSGSAPQTTYEENWTAVREEEFYRLPDWCIELCGAQATGQLPPCTADELANATDAYFSVVAPIWVAEEASKLEASMSD